MRKKLEKIQEKIWEMQKLQEKGSEKHDVLESVYQSLQDAIDAFEE